MKLQKQIQERWSPREFSDKAIAEADMFQLFEAARWAPSCYNEQPWRFIFACKKTAKESTDFDRLAECLVDGNAWAKNAAALVLTIANPTFEHNGKPNAYSWHDVGLATAQLILQAEYQGIKAHPMAGFDKQKAKSSLGIPTAMEPVAMIALGYPVEGSTMPDVSQRDRRGLDDVVYQGRWPKGA